MAVATELGLMPNHFYCLLKAYETDPRSRSLLPKDPGPQAVGAVSISASRQPPFARLSSGRGDLQALRLPATARLIPAENVGSPETPIGGVPASVPSAGTFKSIKLMVSA